MSGNNLLVEDARSALSGIVIDSLRGKKILVVGGSGLVGTHFLSCALEMQERLEGQLSVETVVRHRIPPWMEPYRDRVTIRAGDATELDFLRRLEKFDIIIHAATYGQPGLFTAQPKTTLRLNTVTTFALLDKLLDKGKFLFISSSEVYSGLADPPFVEANIGTTGPQHPRACYIEGKRCGETICNSYRQDGIDAKSIRLSSTYGPGVRRGDQRVLYQFIDRALCSGKLELLDAGTARRTFCYISDVGAMAWRILLTGREAVYNVGGIWRTSISNLARAIGDLTDSAVYAPPKSDDGLPGAMEDVQVDIGKYEREFGPHRFFDPSAGLARTIEWCRGLV